MNQKNIGSFLKTFKKGKEPYEGTACGTVQCIVKDCFEMGNGKQYARFESFG